MTRRKLVSFSVLILLIVLLVPAPVLSAGAGSDAAAAAPGLRERVVSFENQGQTVVGTLATPTHVRPPYPTVLILHGFTGTRDELPVVGTDDGMFSRTARMLAEHGYASLRIDFRGSGESDGVFEDTTFTGQISDALVALDYLDRSKKVDDDRLAVLGLSQGGLVTAAVAAADDRVDSIVLWSPVANPPDTYKLILGADEVAEGLVSDVVHIVLPWGAEIDLRRPFFEDLYAVDPVAEITDYDGPMLVVVGSRDDTVTPQPYYGQLYLNYHDGAEHLTVLDGDHVFDVLTDAGPAVLDQAIAESLAWLDGTMP